MTNATSERLIARCPPRDGREWDVQCARCGSSCVHEDCDYCGGEGYNESDDWQDDDDVLIPCNVCQALGGWWHCCSSPAFCEANPCPGREAVTRGKLEWFTFDRRHDVATDAATQAQVAEPGKP